MFYKFFSLEYPLKELLFFLYVRSLAERELAIMITKIPSSQDIRHVQLSLAKCLKISKIYFSNVLAVQEDGQETVSQDADFAASRFVESCVAEGTAEG